MSRVILVSTSDPSTSGAQPRAPLGAGRWSVSLWKLDHTTVNFLMSGHSGKRPEEIERVDVGRAHVTVPLPDGFGSGIVGMSVYTDTSNKSVYSGTSGTSSTLEVWRGVIPVNLTSSVNIKLIDGEVFVTFDEGIKAVPTLSPNFIVKNTSVLNTILKDKKTIIISSIVIAGIILLIISARASARRR